MDDAAADLAAALELEGRLHRRAAEQVVASDGGWAVRHRGLSEVHSLNAFVLARPVRGSLDARAVADAADEALRELGHRLIVVPDDAAGARLAPGLLERGYEQRRTLYMALRGDPAGAPRDLRAREMEESELRALQAAVYADDADGWGGGPGLAGRLAGGQAALRAAGTARGFGAGDGGEPHSTAMLFVDGDVAGRRVAMVDQVGTLRMHRGQGLARAAVGAALRAAAAWGAELVVVACDADDWPQLLYASLGFAPIGRTWAFTLRAPRDPRRTAR